MVSLGKETLFAAFTSNDNWKKTGATGKQLREEGRKKGKQGR